MSLNTMQPYWPQEITSLLVHGTYLNKKEIASHTSTHTLTIMFNHYIKLLNLITMFNHLITFKIVLIIIYHLGLITMFNDVK